MKAISIIKYLFAVIGLGMLIGAFFSYQNTQVFLANAAPAQGTVVELLRSVSEDSITYKPVVEFQTSKGLLVQFTSSVGSNPPSYSQGEVVDVLYLESAPQDARINDFFSVWGLTVILAGMGAVFLLIGLSIIFAGALKGRHVRHLKAHGVRINTKFQSVALNRSLTVNGRNPYQILTQWQDPVTTEMHIFESENIGFDPTDHIGEREISVLIERNNPKKYYVDISFLPKLSS